VKNERKRVFGTELYVTFEGNVQDFEGNNIKTYKTNNKVKMFKWKGKTYSLARYVAYYFIGPSKKRIHYIDGNKDNTAAWNLQYVDTQNKDISQSRRMFMDIPEERKEEIFEFIANISNDFYLISDTFNIPIMVAGIFVKINSKNT